MISGHAHWLGREADGPDKVRRITREQLKRGADVVKCIATGSVLTPGVVTGVPKPTEAEIRVLAETVNVKDAPTTAHAHSGNGIESATCAGIPSVEHKMFIDEEAADLMVDNDAYWVPTTSTVHGIVETGVEAGTPPETVMKAENAIKYFEGVQSHALDVGVNIIVSTDAGMPFNDHGENVLREVELFVECNPSPAKALEVAAVSGADLFGSDDVGRAAEGCVAGLVILGADLSGGVGAWWTVR